MASFIGAGSKSGTNPTVTHKAGSDCNGSNGNANRVLTLANTKTSSNEVVFLDGNALKSDLYTANHLSSSSTITFSVRVWDDQRIVVIYFT
jgi:hypothetical protein